MSIIWGIVLLVWWMAGGEEIRALDLWLILVFLMQDAKWSKPE